jgi:hypothetical protein
MFIAEACLAARSCAASNRRVALLDAMLPAGTALANTAGAPKTRYTFVHLPHGAIMGQFTPKNVGKSFDITPILEPLRPYRSYMTVISNLDHQMATSQTPEEAAGDHDRTASVFLSGAHVKRTAGQDIRAGITIDQVLAQHIGQESPLPSLEMCIEDVGALGVCGAGYSCAMRQFLVVADLAIADGAQPAGNLRAVVRRGWHARGARRAARDAGEHSRLRRGRSGVAAARPRAERQGAHR